MAEAVISPVVPPPPAAHRGGRPVRAAAPARGPLPLPRLAAVRTSATVYGLAVLDCRGRVADRAVLGALGWRAGTPPEIPPPGGLLVINAAPRAGRRVCGAAGAAVRRVRAGGGGGGPRRPRPGLWLLLEPGRAAVGPAADRRAHLFGGPAVGGARQGARGGPA